LVACQQKPISDLFSFCKRDRTFDAGTARQVPFPGMRTFIAFIASVLGSVGFQMSVDMGYLKQFGWAVPWVWAACAALWSGWLMSHDKVTNGWTKAFHIKVGKGIHVIRTVICVLVFVATGAALQVLLRPKHVITQTATGSMPTAAIEEKQDAPETQPGKIKPIPDTKPSKKLATNDLNSQRSVQIEQPGAESGAIGGSVNAAPCSNVQVGGNSNQASVNCAAEPTQRTITDVQALALVKALLLTPAPFWMMTGTNNHGGQKGGPREDIDEQGMFELRLENLLITAGWEDFIQTGCKDTRNLLAAKHSAGINGDDGNAPLEQFVSMQNGAIRASLFTGIPGCLFPAYEDPFHGILIESPQEFMDAAQHLNTELGKLRIRSRVRRSDVLSEQNQKRLECIFVHVGTL
jgi:hypothetical protein